MTSVQLFTLSSGVRCAFLASPSPVAYCALTTLSGTRFEPAQKEGLAHFCEHMLFKGTERRKSFHINNRLERLGGEINAFTTKEELVLQTTSLKEDVAKALELIADLAFHSVIPEQELIKERQVILDEIRSYKDSPMDLIYDRFEELLFQGTPMATPILGTAKSLKRIHREDLLDYLQTRFRPENMVLSIVGHLSPARAIFLAEKYFGKEQIAPSTSASPKETMTPTLVPPFSITEKRNTYQIHYLTGTSAYPAHHPLRVPLILLMNLLGGPASNARLNMLLREKYALVYTVEGSYNPYMDTGFAGIYFGTDKPKLDQCCQLMEKTLKDFSTRELSSIQLDRAKKQFIGQMAVSSDNPEVQCLSMGKSVLSYGVVLSHAQMVDVINKVTPSQIMEVASQIWDPQRRSSLIYE